MAQTIQMTNEQLRELIETVRSGSAVGVASSSKSKGSFSACTHRFFGSRSHDEVEEFITNIVTYKELEEISDENALKGVSLLFYGLASTWWQGVRKEAKCWNDVIVLIREHFSPAKPAHQVYTEFFEERQEDDVVIDTFVVEKRALLAQLPEGRHNEETELDFLYGLLNIKYRKHIARQSVPTFRDLLEQGRVIEHNNQEENQPKTSRKRPLPECWDTANNVGRGRGGARGRGRGRARNTAVQESENNNVMAGEIGNVI
ncbi:activity-regulated cytoskeleton associated protein 1 [Drosophila virilis]|uniref:Ty3 transposon capsid-like protein domain-containing protein n=1 Tax=Drosophila virilis TaxID=7244 RepID=A0A0Q9WG01_DROVI|nr:activity-regulated cytoskeleton associated protein 1 [Drosophila virilis]KRF79966.1 uncharacterized protein Dvir_GJ26163 [Drosophila virilis]